VERVTPNSVCYKSKLLSALSVHNMNLNAGVLPAVAQSCVRVAVALRGAVKDPVNMGLCYHSSPEEVHVSCPAAAKLAWMLNTENTRLIN